MNVFRRPLRQVRHRAVALALIVALPQWAFAVQDPFAGVPALKDEQLDELRGGFESVNGLQFSFAIERAVVVNGELVTSTRLVFNDLAPLLSGGMPMAQIITSARNIVQNGLGNTVSSAPAATSAPPAAAAAVASTTPAVGEAPGSAISPAVAAVASLSPSTPTSIAPASAVAAPSVAATAPAAAAPANAGVAATATPASMPASSVAATAAPAFVQMNVAGQTILIPTASALVTGVQNTVNNQIIQTRTTIDAMLNSLSALRATTLANTIRQDALNAVQRP